jgi:hypothetical protein
LTAAPLDVPDQIADKAVPSAGIRGVLIDHDRVFARLKNQGYRANAPR